MSLQQLCVAAGELATPLQLHLLVLPVGILAPAHMATRGFLAVPVRQATAMVCVHGHV